MFYLKELLNLVVEMLTDWPFGTLAGFFVVGALLLALAYSASLAFEFVDQRSSKARPGIANVRGKKFVPEHTRFVMAGKIPVPQKVCAKWLLTVEVGGHYDTIPVPSALYEKVQAGDTVEVDFVYGYLSGRLYIKNVY